MKVKPNHPLQELLGKLLFGIEIVPPKEQIRMVNLACKEAVKWYEKQIELSWATKEPLCPYCKKEPRSKHLNGDCP